MAPDKADLLQGTLGMLILKALSPGPLHGYGVIRRTRQMSGGCSRSSRGRSTRPSTASGSGGGWPPSGATAGRRAKFYTLTRAGRRRLAAEEASRDRLVLAVSEVRRAT